MSKIKNTSTLLAVVILKKNSWCIFTLTAAATQKKRKIPAISIRRCISIQATVVTRKKKSILASQMAIQHTIIPTTTTRTCTGFTCIFWRTRLVVSLWLSRLCASKYGELNWQIQSVASWFQLWSLPQRYPSQSKRLGCSPLVFTTLRWQKKHGRLCKSRIW